MLSQENNKKNLLVAVPYVDFILPCLLLLIILPWCVTYLTVVHLLPLVKFEFLNFTTSFGFCTKRKVGQKAIISTSITKNRLSAFPPQSHNDNVHSTPPPSINRKSTYLPLFQSSHINIVSLLLFSLFLYGRILLLSLARECCVWPLSVVFIQFVFFLN